MQYVLHYRPIRTVIILLYSSAEVSGVLDDPPTRWAHIRNLPLLPSPPVDEPGYNAACHKRYPFSHGSSSEFSGYQQEVRQDVGCEVGVLCDMVLWGEVGERGSSTSAPTPVGDAQLDFAQCLHG